MPVKLNRPTTTRPRGAPSPWTRDVDTVIHILHAEYGCSLENHAENAPTARGLNYDESLEILQHLYPLILQYGYASGHIYDRHQPRFNDPPTRPRYWREIDRPNRFNRSRYTQVELRDFARLRVLVHNAARALGITLVPVQPAPWSAERPAGAQAPAAPVAVPAQGNNVAPASSHAEQSPSSSAESQGETPNNGVVSLGTGDAGGFQYEANGDDIAFQDLGGFESYDDLFQLPYTMEQSEDPALLRNMQQEVAPTNAGQQSDASNNLAPTSNQPDQPQQDEPEVPYIMPENYDELAREAFLPMVHGCDLVLNDFSRDCDRFVPFYTGRNGRIQAKDDASLDVYTGYISPYHPIYQYGGPVYRVLHPWLGLIDTMLCNTDICNVCNYSLPLDFQVPGSEQSPTKGYPFVHTLRDCREAEEDGTLPFWQIGKHAMFAEDYPPELQPGNVRFTTVGMLGSREAAVCVPENCDQCKGFIGKQRVESNDGGLVVWKETKKDGDDGEDGKKGDENAVPGSKTAGKKAVRFAEARWLKG